MALKLNVLLLYNNVRLFIFSNCIVIEDITQILFLNLHMSIIKLPLRYEGSKGEKILYTLLIAVLLSPVLLPGMQLNLQHLKKCVSRLR